MCVSVQVSHRGCGGHGTMREVSSSTMWVPHELRLSGFVAGARPSQERPCLANISDLRLVDSAVTELEIRRVIYNMYHVVLLMY